MNSVALPSLDDPSDFNFTSFQSLDSSLRCQICHELFTAPVILTTCSHTFDSLCLRNHLREIKKCPQCSKEANEDKIKRNLVVEELVNGWRKSRSHLLQLEAQASTPSTSLHPTASTSKSTNFPPPTPAASSISTRQSSKRKLLQHSPSPTSSSKLSTSRKKIKSEPSEITLDDDDEDEVVDASSDVEVIDDPGMSSSLRKRPKRETTASEIGGLNGLRASQRNSGKAKGKEKVPDPKDPSILVTCPLCSKLVKNGSISAHIDSSCINFVISNGSNTPSTKGKGKGKAKENAFGRLMGMSGSTNATNTNGYGSSTEELTSTESNPIPHDTTKYLALPNYAHKKLKEVESLLKSLNLPITVPASHSRSNDSKIIYLKKRHSQYLTFWNANADIAPGEGNGHKNPKELKEELKRWEKILLEEEKDKEKVEKAKGKNGSGSTSSTANLPKSRDNDFKSLIEQARASHFKDKEMRERKRLEELQNKVDEVAEDGQSSKESNKETELSYTPNEGGPSTTTQTLDGATETTLTNSATPQEVSNAPSTQRREDEMQVDVGDESAPPTLPISPPPQLSSELSDLLDSNDSAPLPAPTKTRRTVRIQTPPPVPSSSLSPPPTDRIPTPPPLNSRFRSPGSANAEEEEEEGEARGQRSSSILEYDEKFFPPTSQRVREVDWDMIRKARAEEEEDEEDDED